MLIGLHLKCSNPFRSCCIIWVQQQLLPQSSTICLYNASSNKYSLSVSSKSYHYSFLSRGQNLSLEPVRNCNNNNSSPLHAVGLAAITQLVRQDPSPGRAPVIPSPLRPTAEFPGVLPTDVVVELPSPTHERERNSRFVLLIASLCLKK